MEIEAGIACPQVLLAVERAYLVAVTQLVLAEESPCPWVEGTACSVEARVDVREGSQVEVGGRLRSFRKEVVA